MTAQTVTMRAPAMACEFAIQLPASRPDGAATDRAGALRAFDLVEDLESLLSIYREESELSRVNRLAAREPQAVRADLFSLLQRCKAWTAETDGAFDVTAGPLIRTWGFFARAGRVPSSEELGKAQAACGMDLVELDPLRRTVSFRREGVEINPGAVGKGYSLDRLAAFLKTAGYRQFLLSAGASSLLGWGRPPWDDAWMVELRHPLEPRRALCLIKLSDHSLSTSGIAEQQFVSEGKRYAHILDPRSGKPAAGMLQATAIAGDAATAEALSTAFFVNGPQWTE
ncbi:MAG TPA: FAD:protein FMN transferase, partial [Planctomycetia bacterium]|nr:FAD:protein FMN transferase [Planctomycetia bacterium]